MPIEPSQNVGQPRPIGAIDARLVRQAAGERPSAPDKSAAPALTSVSAVLDAGPIPVDASRVTQIRKAIEAGTYPLLPTTVADAIIAAGLLLRSPR